MQFESSSSSYGAWARALAALFSGQTWNAPSSFMQQGHQKKMLPRWVPWVGIGSVAPKCPETPSATFLAAAYNVAYA